MTTTGTPERTAVSSAAAPVPAPLRIVVAVVLPDQSVRPLPLHQLEVVAEADSAQRVMLRTALDGTATHALLPGRYRARSMQGAPVNDSTYQWNVPFEVTAGSGARLELTNANASIAVAVGARPAARQVAPERDAFEKARRGVFRVEAGLGHGTGFLIALPGVSDALVVTNDHVVAGQTRASVYLDTVSRVPAQVVARDQEADLAILRIPAGRCADCPRLPLARPQGGEPLVVPGERVLAIGFPLSQDMTLTTGVASSVRDGAVISDVNINPGNSGGPMLTVEGQVVAINTFGESSGRVGPGVSGAVAVTKLTRLLGAVPAALETLPQLEDRQMPAMPRTVYPLASLKAHADTIEPRGYRKLLERNAGNFLVSTSTPVLQRVAARVAEDDVAKDRRKREQKGNVAAEEQYSEVNATRDWEQYVGDGQTPVVTLAVVPKIGETFWSAFGRGLQAASGSYMISPATLKFRGDVRGVRVYRNGVEIEAIRGGHGPQAVRLETGWVKLKDVADMGYYVLPPETFEPDSTGAPALVSIVVQDLKNLNTLSATDIDGAASARVWNDFAPYYAALGTPRRLADARRKSPRIPLTCDARTGDCTIKP